MDRLAMAAAVISALEAIAGLGTRLPEECGNGYALDRNAVLAAVFKIGALGVPILGGDVLEDTDGDKYYTYENWSCERFEGETLEDYAKRSVRVTHDYVSGYDGGAEARFVLVIPRSLAEQ